MNTARNHHYVPQCYLKRFTRDCDVTSQLMAFDLAERRPFPTTPRNVCAERDFNRVDLPDQPPDVLEKLLGGFDDEADRALQGVTATRTLEDRKALVVLLNLASVLATRNPSLRRAMEAAHQRTVEIIGDLLTSNPALYQSKIDKAKRAGEIAPDADVPFEKIGAFIRNRKYEVTFPVGFHIVTEMDIQDDVLQALMDRNWALLRAPAGSQFITCDRPVSLWCRTKRRAPAGFRTPDTMVVLPLSPELLLMGQFDGIEGEFDVPCEHVATLNEGVALRCDRFVYARSADFDCYDASDKLSRGPEHLYRTFADTRG